LVTALIEADAALVVLVCREFYKTVRMMLQKVEGMILTNPESRLDIRYININKYILIHTNRY
jgi:hypothetical protein